jgi:hypothetical protein
MANTQFLSTTELDQDAQKQAFIQFLKTNPYFKGVNYGWRKYQCSSLIF